jgi:hypothetical protein
VSGEIAGSMLHPSRSSPYRNTQPNLSRRYSPVDSLSHRLRFLSHARVSQQCMPPPSCSTRRGAPEKVLASVTNWDAISRHVGVVTLRRTRPLCKAVSGRSHGRSAASRPFPATLVARRVGCFLCPPPAGRRSVQREKKRTR